MKQLLKHKANWLTKILLILVGFFVFQSSIITVSACTMNSGFDPNNPISETYTHDEIGSPVWVKDSHSGRVSWVLSKNEVGSECEVLIDESSVSAKTSTSAARLSTIGVKLTQQLASEAQMSQAGRTIISNLRSGPRLAQQYGGKAADWVKKSSSSFSKNGKTFETHWYQNVSTGQRVEFKTKLIQGW